MLTVHDLLSPARACTTHDLVAGATSPIAVEALDDALLLWLVVGGVAAIAVLIAALVLLSRMRRRKRRELFADAVGAVETLLVLPVPATTVNASADPDQADEVRDAAERVRGALTDLERASRFETSAAALALRHHATELGNALEDRLRGEGDPYLLDVRINELRERVRGARDRLAAAVRT